MAYKNLCLNIIKESRILDRYLRTAVTIRGYSKTANTSSEDNSEERSTHFGFQTIKENQKAREGENFIIFVECLSLFYYMEY